MRLSTYPNGRDMSCIYKPELWPQVSYLVVFEMAKRAWSLYKLYVVNVFLALDRRPCLPPMQVEAPKPVDDQVLPFAMF